MSDTVLIDPPVTPYSPMGDLLAWVQVCRDALADAPGSRDWQAALADAERLVAEAGAPGT